MRHLISPNKITPKSNIKATKIKKLLQIQEGLD